VVVLPSWRARKSDDEAEWGLGNQTESNICQQQTTMSEPAPTQVNVSDLELPQLVEVKKQLEEVCNWFPAPTLYLIPASSGTLTPDQFFCPTEASAGKVPLVHRKCKGGQAREQRYIICVFAQTQRTWLTTFQTKPFWCPSRVRFTFQENCEMWRM
jgi:hypothetical protein